MAFSWLCYCRSATCLLPFVLPTSTRPPTPAVYRITHQLSHMTGDFKGQETKKKVSRSRFSRAGQLDLQLSVKKGATMTPFPAAREQGVDFFFCSFFSLVQWCHIRAVELSGRWTESNMSRTYPFTIWKKWLASRCLPAPTRGRFIFLEAC